MREPEADGLKVQRGLGRPCSRLRRRPRGLGRWAEPPRTRRLAEHRNQPTTGRGLARIPSLGKQALSGESEKGQSWVSGVAALPEATHF
jgi:hypothetical protein